MVTLKYKEEVDQFGKTLIEYKSFIFGGLILNEMGNQVPTNDLYEVRTKTQILPAGYVESADEKKIAYRRKLNEDLEMAMILP